MIKCCVIFSCIADSVSWLRPQSLAKTAIVYLTESPFLIFRLATLLGGTVISTSRITSSFKLAIALDYENENGCATVILPVYFFATVFLNKKLRLESYLTHSKSRSCVFVLHQRDAFSRRSPSSPKRLFGFLASSAQVLRCWVGRYTWRALALLLLPSLAFIRQI